MKKNLEDYLHLYMGIDCQVDDDHIGKLLGYSARGIGQEDMMVFYTVQMGEYEDDWTVYNDDRSMQRIKPILRRLNDITDKELQERGFSSRGHYNHWLAYSKEYSSDDFLWFLRNGFDLFGLIKAGLAIDKMQIKSSALSKTKN